jgi:kynureninase
MQPEELYRRPNRLAPHYTAFRVADRLLLTGHSHQAWPDRARIGQLRAWDDAAELVDEKWDRAFAKADRVRRGFGALLGDPGGEFALGPSTHDLLLRFVSALPLRTRPRLVTTDGEFHTIRRQLDRLGEAGIEVVKAAADPADTAAERLAALVDGRTAAVLVSAVFFHNAHRVLHLAALAGACARHGAELLVDTYHALGVVPFSLEHEGLQGAFAVGGGYKYCQLGEGNCFLRIPPGRDFRPVITGWFSEFSALAAPTSGAVVYGGGADRFAGSTYDPTSHYRAAEVFDFFQEQGLTPEFLREVSQHQVGRLRECFDALQLDPSVVRREREVPLERLAGFLALRAPRAGDLCRGLRHRGVLTDFRGDALRFGPAPYLSDDQLDASIDALGEAARSLAAGG